MRRLCTNSDIPSAFTTNNVGKTGTAGSISNGRTSKKTTSEAGREEGEEETRGRGAPRRLGEE